MKRLLVVLITLLLVGCQSAPLTPDPSVMGTIVASTIQAGNSTPTPDTFGFVMMTATPGPTTTPVPTVIPRNIVENFIDDIRLKEYCNKELVPEIIKKFRLIDENSNDTYFEGTDTDNVPVFDNPIMFSNEEDRQIYLEGLRAILKDIEAIDVPECLESAKEKIVFGYKELITVVERNDENWISDLMTAGMIGQSGRDELDRIERCLPTGCK